MPEGTPLYTELTVREFVNYMANLKSVKSNQRKEMVSKVIDETGLSDVQNKLIRNLSRGYKQRVSLAGALVGDPDVIILDEPTVGLDPKQITEIRNLIKNLGKNHTVILSSHILSEVSQICERVVIINHGKIVAIDTPENLENKTKEKNTILVTVEDPKENMKKLKETVKEIEEVKLLKDNEDGTKQYAISSSGEVDLRKKLFEVLPKQEMTIFELKKDESTLEDAFIKLIDTSTMQAATSDEQDKKKKEKKTKKEEKKAQGVEKKEEKVEENLSDESKEKKEEQVEEQKENSSYESIENKKENDDQEGGNK